jgi:hypothetical protein
MFTNLEIAFYLFMNVCLVTLAYLVGLYIGVITGQKAEIANRVIYKEHEE